MFCCANCFGDGHLRDEIIPRLSSTKGVCSYCKSEEQDLVAPALLREHFELLTSIYLQHEDGRFLVEWLKDDWALFSHARMDIAHAKELLADILDDGDIVRKSFFPSERSISDALEKWETLRAELMHANRYFPKTEINHDRLRRLFSFLLLKEGELPQRWFRARIQSGELAFRSDEMGAPPKHLASHGRANPAGIPYLYLASTALTAISEIRPHTGEVASVAEFSILRSLKIADLRHPKNTISPFILDDEDEIALLRGDVRFLEKLGEELTRPVIPRSAAFDYIPSQYLCEFAKSCGFDGVMYRSSVGDGVNVALFEPAHARVIEITRNAVLRAAIDFARLADTS
jgi:hypothetical protein